MPVTPVHLRVAIVGSGPAGFYSAGHLQKYKDFNFSIDMFDRLPTPWGLVRAGVAPDHPNIKAVSRVYEKIAAHPGFRFYGNVEIGRDLSRTELTESYNAVIYAVGAQADNRMGISGEDLPGSWAATEFVAWYNGHPDYRELDFDLSCERVAVIGNGNVAADVARMLALTVDELAHTDVADHALEALSASAVREIIVLGRRGPAQAAFTNPEVLELGELADTDVVVDSADVELDPLTAEWLASCEAGMTARRNVEIFTEYSRRAPAGKPRRISLRFLTSPVAIEGAGRVESITVRRNELVADAGGAIRARATDEIDTIPVGLVFRSVGYRGVPMPGLPFDERRAVIPNASGRVLDGVDGEILPGEYTVGWIKRGPSGIIGTNKKDAQETIDCLLHDATAGALPVPSESAPSTIERLLTERNPSFVSYAGWETIDRAERDRGEAQGRPRVKYCTYRELLNVASSPEAATVVPQTADARGLDAVTRYLGEQGIAY
jgi:ferredoxin--NADP+ reductase